MFSRRSPWCLSRRTDIEAFLKEKLLLNIPSTDIFFASLCLTVRPSCWFPMRTPAAVMYFWAFSWGDIRNRAIESHVKRTFFWIVFMSYVR